jgi:acetyl-CoA carboxylase biotin carboxyl carrier protein
MGDNMNYAEVRKLVKLVETSNIHELEIEEDGTKIRVSKADLSAIQAHTNYVATLPAQQQVVEAAPVQIASEAPVATPAKNYNEIKSPMVGTFYLAPSPDSDPYTKVGDHVSAGDTLCIVEAMKLMNEIESDVSGTIVEILVENAEPVEFGQPMFLIDPKG